MREKLHSLKEQHESEILRLQQSHAKDLSALMQQVEHQRSSIRCLEAEKNAINQDLNKSEELMEERERELKSVTQLLHTKEDALQATQGEQRELLKRLEAEEEKVRSYQEESDALTMKCTRQDDEYGMLLQERDYLQAELTKEQDRNKRLEKRVELLEMEHGKQMECLQQAYRDQMLTHCPDFSNAIDEESFRQRYQSEIEQLRVSFLCNSVIWKINLSCGIKIRRMHAHTYTMHIHVPEFWKTLTNCIFFDCFVGHHFLNGINKYLLTRPIETYIW